MEDDQDMDETIFDRLSGIPYLFPDLYAHPDMIQAFHF